MRNAYFSDLALNKAPTCTLCYLCFSCVQAGSRPPVDNLLPARLESSYQGDYFFLYFFHHVFRSILHFLFSSVFFPNLRNRTKFIFLPLGNFANSDRTPLYVDTCQGHSYRGAFFQNNRHFFRAIFQDSIFSCFVFKNIGMLTNLILLLQNSGEFHEQ